MVMGLLFENRVLTYYILGCIVARKVLDLSVDPQHAVLIPVNVVVGLANQPGKAASYLLAITLVVPIAILNIKNTLKKSQFEN